ncbi:MAG: gamma-mobile-trio protein GmtX [Colwellia sp.]|nr:gamma-mobile-trio protein GmtX [Colwellia sp.]
MNNQLIDKSICEPEEMFEHLIKGASSRVVKGLTILHKVCNEQSERGSTDFTIATIGRLTEDAGSIKVQTIRNKTGNKYQALIESWSEFKKPLKIAKGKIKEQDAWINDISSPRIQWLVRDLMAEKSRLIGQLQKAKMKANIHIDMRPIRNVSIKSNSPNPILTPVQRKALAHAIDEATLRRNHWLKDDNGRVYFDSNDGKNEIFRPGFIQAIENILAT